MFLCVVFHRAPDLSWGGIGPHGALPDTGDPAAAFPVHLARGCRRARLHPCVWGHSGPKALQDGGEAQKNYGLREFGCQLHVIPNIIFHAMQ